MAWKITEIRADYGQMRGWLKVEEQPMPTNLHGYRSAYITFEVSDKVGQTTSDEEYLRRKAKQTLLDAAEAL